MSIPPIEGISNNSTLLASSLSQGGQLGADPMDPVVNKIMSTYDKDNNGLLSETEMTHMSKKAFEIIDKDGNGSLDKDEIKGYASQAVGQVLSSKELASALSSLPGGAGIGGLAGLAGKMIQQAPNQTQKAE